MRHRLAGRPRPLGHLLKPVRCSGSGGTSPGLTSPHPALLRLAGARRRGPEFPRQCSGPGGEGGPEAVAGRQDGATVWLSGRR